MGVELEAQCIGRDAEMVRQCDARQGMRGEILAAILFKLEPLPAFSFVFTQQARAGLGGFLIQQVIGVCEPKVERHIIHCCGSYPALLSCPSVLSQELSALNRRICWCRLLTKSRSPFDFAQGRLSTPLKCAS